MALQVENFFISELNLTLPTAYCRFSGLFWHGSINIDIRTDIYANEEARDKNLQPITSKQYSVLLNDPMAGGDLAAGKIQPLVYALLKTLPEFKGAVDA